MHPVDLIAHQSFSCLNYAGLRPFLIPNIHGVILALGDLGVTQLLHRGVLCDIFKSLIRLATSRN